MLTESIFSPAAEAICFQSEMIQAWKCCLWFEGESNGHGVDLILVVLHHLHHHQVLSTLLLVHEWTDPFTFLIQGHEHRERQTRLVTQVTQFLKTHDNKKSLVVIPASKRSISGRHSHPWVNNETKLQLRLLDRTSIVWKQATLFWFWSLTKNAGSSLSCSSLSWPTETEITWEGHGLRSPELYQTIGSKCVIP